MTDSTDREKLIQEASDAMHDVYSSCPPFGGLDIEGMARTALAVFEKAHTPTDDEREALLTALDPSSRRNAWASRTVERVIAAGFHLSVTATDDERADAAQRWPIPVNFQEGDPEHTLLIAQRHAYLLGRSDARTRSEVPEPSAERIGCNICGEALPDGEPHLCSAPQGEPSDAPTRRVAHTGPGHASGDAGYCEGCLAEREQRAAGIIPGEPFTLDDLAREHERLAEHPNQMKQTIPAFHSLTAKALRWAALRAAGVGGVR